MNAVSLKTSGKNIVSFIGLGYVGLCTAAVFASKNVEIIGVDIDRDRINSLNAGKTPIHEPNLDRLLKNGLRRKRLRFTTDASEILSSNITFFTVGTPLNDDGTIDLSFVEQAAQNTGSNLRHEDEYHTVVVKSTVTPGITESTVR